MQTHEYKVIPAPTRGRKARGVKTQDARFAHGIETTLNEMAAEGWEFLRAEMLPSEERAGLTGTKTTWRNLLVFRRPLVHADGTLTVQQAPAGQKAPIDSDAAQTPPTSFDTAEAAQPEPAASVNATVQAQPIAPPRPPLVATAGDPEAVPGAPVVPGPGARRMYADDGVEELSPVSGLTAALRARAGRRDDAES